MKHIRDFNTLQEAKTATLYSPVLTRVAEGENSKLLMLSLGIPDAKCKITGNTLDDVKVVLDDPKYQYLTIEPLAEGTTFYLFKRTNPTITKTVDLKYSLDDGKTWTQYTMPAAGQNGASIPIPMGSKLLLKGNNEAGGFNDCYKVGDTTNNKQAYYMLGTGQQYVHGNLLSLVYGDDFIGKTSYPNDGCFGRLFQTNTVIKKVDIYVTTDNNKYTGLYMFGLLSAGGILETVKISGALVGDGCINMFYNCSALQSVDFTGCDLSSVMNMKAMFYNCSSLQSVDFTGCDLSSVTDMSYMFYQCSALQSVDFTGCDLSSVTDMSYMFGQCSVLQSIDFTGYNLSSVTYMYAMFYQCSALQSVDFTGCDLSSVTNMDWMFGKCENASNVELKLQGSLSQPVSMSYMFISTAFKKIDFSELTAVISMLDSKGKNNGFQYFHSKISGAHLNPTGSIYYMDLSGISLELLTSQPYDICTHDYGVCTNLTYLRLPKWGKFNMNANDTGNYSLSYAYPNVTDKHGTALHIVQNLPQLTSGETYYVNFGDAYLNTLSDAEKQIAIDKGWTLQGDAPALTSAMPPMTTATAPNEVEHDIECPTPPDNEAMM